MEASYKPRFFTTDPASGVPKVHEGFSEEILLEALCPRGFVPPMSAFRVRALFTTTGPFPKVSGTGTYEGGENL